MSHVNEGGRNDHTSAELLQDHKNDALLGHSRERSCKDGNEDSQSTCH
jgi:hypothetical protein